MNFTSLLNMVATLAILLAVGFGSRKLGLIDDVFSKKLSRLVVNIGQPMLIINSLISQEYSTGNLKRGLLALAISFGLHSFMAVLAFLFARSIKDFDKRKISEFGMVFVNAGFIGFPILESLFGADGLFCGAFYLIGFHMFLWTWGILILSRGRDDIKPTPRKIFLNYGTVPCFIGFALYLSNVPLPGFLTQPVGYLAELCTPLTMMIAGSLIATGSLKKLFGAPINYFVAMIKLLVMPAIVCLCLNLVGLDDFYVIFGTVMAALPSASMVTILGELYGVNPAFASRIVGFTTISCTLTLPVAVKFAQFIVSLW
ncbi:MAG: AEC family transporter [Clostridia bacterium]|nr:AEC family transporter [Clostridia bacterium]